MAGNSKRLPVPVWSARSGTVWAIPRSRSQVRMARELCRCRRWHAQAESGPSGVGSEHVDGLHDGGELGAVVGVAAGDGETERAAQSVTHEVDFAAQAAPGPPEPRAAPLSGPGSDHLNLRLGGPQHPFKDAAGRPPAEPGVRGGSGSVPLGLTSPGRARTELPYDPVQDHLVVQPLFPAGTADGSARANSRSESDSSWRRITRPPIRRDHLTTSPRRTPARRPAPRSPPGSCRQRRRRPGSSRHRPRRDPRRNRCRCRPRKPRPW